MVGKASAVDNNATETTLYRFNFDRALVLLRNWVLKNYAAARLGDTAAAVYEHVLNVCTESIHHCKLDEVSGTDGHEDI